VIPSQYLFVYGTLLRDSVPPAIAGLCRRLRRLGDATIAGALYDLGNYPALSLNCHKDSSDTIKGELVCVFSPADWLRLDTYEGCDNAQPDRSLYRRIRTTATLARGEKVECWVYVYNRALTNVPRIDQGCWRTHLRERDSVDDDIIVIPC
jgi:gamma-glutamylcyclotransferase (GGCT)/AIG2-like uncharacterized protein YtfP